MAVIPESLIHVIVDEQFPAPFFTYRQLQDLAENGAEIVINGDGADIHFLTPVYGPEPLLPS